MMLEPGLNEKGNAERSTVIPVTTVVPAVTKSTPEKHRLIVIILLFILIGLITLGLFMIHSPRDQDLNQDGSDFTDVDYELLASMQSKLNFDVRIDIDGERCLESIHADHMQNIVTFHYTGENGREGGMAVYDFNQGLVALKNSNGTSCLFANAYDLPRVLLSDLQLKARNKEVMNIQETVTMEIDGIIPGGFLQLSGGPVFEDLCRDLPSYWMVLAPSINSGNEDRRRARRSDPPKSGGITVTVPAGGTATVIVIQGGGTVVISL